MNIEKLYHWSPRKNRESILRTGLKLHYPPTLNSKAASSISCSVCVSHAWEHSAECSKISGTWDLYEVTVSPTDDIKILEFWGSSGMGEVLIRNEVKPENLKYVASRENEAIS